MFLKISVYIGSLKNSTENVYGEFEKIFELGEGVKDVCVHFPWSVCSILKELRLKENSMLYDLKFVPSKVQTYQEYYISLQWNKK